MEDEPSPEEICRLPVKDDLVALCRELNARGARYLVVGGMAVVHHGYLRATEDIDILLESSLENQRRVCSAMETLPDQAILELEGADLRDLGVVRVADEVVVDLMLAACGISYEEAVSQAETFVYEGVPIPFASVDLLMRMKQTFREKDAIDRIFLQQVINEREKRKNSPTPASGEITN